MKIKKLKLGKKVIGSGYHIYDSLEERLLDPYEPKHSILDEFKLIEVLEEVENKINEILEKLRK